MAQFNGPGPASSGLVYILDNNNQRSYAGPPIQNVANAITPNPVSGANIEYTVGSQFVTIPNLGTMSVSFVNGYNSNPSSFCCIQSYSYIQGGRRTVTGSTTYTYSIVYKNTSGYTHPNFMYRYEFNSAGTYLTEGGVFDTAKRISLGDGWFWAWNTFTTQPTTTQIELYGFQYNYNVSDIWYTARVLVTPGDYTQLNPSFWPALGTTRTSTQVFSDPLGSSALTATNLTYASNGTIGFNGTTSRITSPSIPALDFAGSQQYTVMAWIYPLLGGGTWHGIVSKGESQQYAFTVNSPGAYIHYETNQGGVGALDSAGGSITQNAWQYVGIRFDGTNKTIWKNGEIIATQAAAVNSISNTEQLRVGEGNANELFNGNITQVAIYNRALSNNEVMQNFNATRGRYGI
jgi:hypothetical protein